MIKALLMTAAVAVCLSTVIPTSAEAQSCRTLRQACLMKDSLGEQGQGNCRRFRERCGGDIGGGGGGMDRCERLRRACMFKDERGETGQGNCRRFREECGRG